MTPATDISVDDRKMSVDGGFNNDLLLGLMILLDLTTCTPKRHASRFVALSNERLPRLRR